MAVSTALSGQKGKRGSRDGMGVRFACYPYGSVKGLYEVPWGYWYCRCCGLHRILSSAEGF